MGRLTVHNKKISTDYNLVYKILAKSYFEVLRKIISQTKVEEFPISCPLIDHDESLYPAVNIFSHGISHPESEIV
jgi:hypothetical protein